MARYPLQPLLTVREYRENSAQSALRQAERAVGEAEQALLACREELERYRTWRAEEDNRRYEAIMHQLLSVQELEDFKAGLARLRDAELKREEDVSDAEKALSEAREVADLAKNRLLKARRETARILAHKDIWIIAARREAERKEELESEEFKPMPVGTGQDD
jgi:type III secretion protein O